MNFAVQRIIDRIVFLRICEDRGIEPYGTLQGLRNGQQVYKRLVERFHRADERYNSGLFQFEQEKDRGEGPDEITPELSIDDKPLKDILGRLYYPDSPYEFAVFPAEILGQVYEQFLGKVIRLTPGHQAKIEEKPEVRKAGGVYYTPAYIVDYIVKNTVGKLVEGKSPQEVGGLTETWKSSKTKRPITVLDPACGSGSFLLGAYQYLLNWYRDQYVADDPQKHATGREPRLYQQANGQWWLTTAERKRILLAHIYGVDIDTQAVEVTKLSLLLKVLEGESGESLERQLRLLHERALPDLGDNIKCGNSLIGPDFYQNQQMSLLDEEERLRINVFDWSGKDGFHEIMQAGGFDAVIGNPPYVLLQSLGMPPVFEYLERNYISARYKIDTYQVFTEKALVLVKNGGLFGLITPNTFLRNKHAIELRRLLLANTEIESLQLHDYPVFHGASVDTCVGIFRRNSTGAASSHTVIVERLTTPTESKQLGHAKQSDWQKREDLNFDLPGDKNATRVLTKIRTVSTRLGDFATAYFGIQTHDRKRFVSGESNGLNWKPAIDGGNIGRYSLSPPVEWVNVEPLAIKSGGNSKVYENLRVGVRQIGRRPIATLLPASWYSLNTIYNIFFVRPVDYDLRYILGIIASKLCGWYWETNFYDQKRTFPKIKKGPLLSIPIRTIDFSKKIEAGAHKEIVNKVQQMLDLNKRLGEVKTEHEKTALRRQIDATDRHIDQLVYELYGLTADEIRLVEESTS